MAGIVEDSLRDRKDSFWDSLRILEENPVTVVSAF